MRIYLIYPIQHRGERNDGDGEYSTDKGSRGLNMKASISVRSLVRRSHCRRIAILW
jgi:hypothetical protein